MSNGMTARVNEFRRVAGPCFEGFSLYGTEGVYMEATKEYCLWAPKHATNTQQLSVEEMRDPLPPEFLAALGAGTEHDSVYGDHEGSHPYLVNEFVSAIASERIPAINAWEAARYLAPGVMAHKSAMKDGEWMDVPDWGDAPTG